MLRTSQSRRALSATIQNTLKLNSIIKYNQVFMKKLNKIINIIMLSSFIVSVILSILLYIGLSNEIGDITYDASIDNKNFVTQGHIYQYYQLKMLLKNTLLPSISPPYIFKLPINIVSPNIPSGFKSSFIRNLYFPSSLIGL